MCQNQIKGVGFIVLNKRGEWKMCQNLIKGVKVCVPYKRGVADRSQLKGWLEMYRGLKALPNMIINLE